MILRKPYAFLIKHFRLIHFILVVLMAYLIYKTSFILKFFNEYISSSQLIQLQDFSSQLYNIYMFLLPFLVIVFFGILLSVLAVKKKPYTFYLVNIIIYIILLIVYTTSLSTIDILEVELMETKTIRLMRDIILIVLSLQIISIIVCSIRAIGFDIKKFDFGQDLAELEVEEEDNEEFEVAFELDTAKVKRNFRRNIRYAKYVYIENKFLINMTTMVFASVIIFVFYLNINIYNKTYNELEGFMGTDFTMMVNKSLITNQDYKGTSLNDDKTLIVVELKIKRNYLKEMAFTYVNLPLIINDHKFYHTNKYRDKIYDLGKSYEKTIINNKFENILLVYEVPNYLVKEDMIVKYIDKISYTSKGINPKYVTIKINPINIDKNIKTTIIQPKESIKLEKKFFDKGTLTINDIDINSKFLEQYQFCLTEKNCYKGYEYIKPPINDNYDKALIKVNGQLENGNVIKNVDEFIKNFGYITYGDINLKKQNNSLKRVIPKMINLKDTYYYEIESKILKEKEIYLNIKFRNNIYTYKIK